jgi:hypothetical protein
MERRKRRRIVLVVLLIISAGNYTRLFDNEEIRTVQFLSVFAIGAIASLLIRELVVAIRNKN